MSRSGRQIVSRRLFIGTVAAGSVVGALAIAGFNSPTRTLGTAENPPETAPVPVGYSTGSSLLFGATTDVDRTLDVIAASHGTVVRIDIMWHVVQPNLATYDWSMVDYVVDAARARNLNILGVLWSCPTWAGYGTAPTVTTRPASAAAFGAFAGTVAGRYNGRISAYEIWNEPNGRQFFAPTPDAAFYTSMVRAAYPKIKAASPTATVVAGAMGPADNSDGKVHAIEFLNQMYTAGLHGHFDALSFHPYDYAAPLAIGALYDNSPMRQMVEMHSIMRRYGDDEKKIWITEYGAPTTILTPQQQSDLIMKTLLQWTEVSYAGAFYIYTVRDANSSSNDDEDRFGVVNTDYSGKSALATVATLQLAGLPARQEAMLFGANRDSPLGAPITPVYEMGGGFAQEHVNGTRFLTNNGWFSSPVPVGSIARRWQLVPIAPFANGTQDFDNPAGFRVFSHATYGTHAVHGAILAAWTTAHGFPTTDEYPYADGVAIDFVNGRIAWSPTTGTTSS